MGKDVSETRHFQSTSQFNILGSFIQKKKIKADHKKGINREGVIGVGLVISL